MRCTRCHGLLLYDRIEKEWRCLVCGRASALPAPRRPVPVQTRPMRERRQVDCA